MNLPLFFALIIFLGAIYIWIGNRASKNLKSNDDYFLMGRGLTFLPLSLTLLATQLGGGMLLGAAQEAYHKGWFVLLYPLGSCLGLFVLGMGFGGKLRKLNISTVAEIFEKIYRSRNQRYVASILSIVAMFFILVAQGIAARLFFASMGADQPIIFIISWFVLIAYTVLGGLKAVVNTDVLQALVIMLFLGIAFFSADPSAMPANPLASVAADIQMAEIPWMAWLFMPLLFMLIEQDMGQRCFAAKNSRVISISAIAAGIVLLACSSIAIYFGVCARNSGLEVAGNASILIESVKAFTNPTVVTLFMVAIIMAIISTADSLLCSIGSNLSCDFLVSEKIPVNRQVRISQILTLITGLGSLALAYFFDNVVMLLMVSYELSVSVLFVPIAAAILSNRPSQLGASCAMVLGAAGFIFFRFVDFPLTKELLTVGISLAGYFSGRFAEYAMGERARV